MRVNIYHHRIRIQTYQLLDMAAPSQPLHQFRQPISPDGIVLQTQVGDAAIQLQDRRGTVRGALHVMSYGGPKYASAQGGTKL